MTRLLSIALCVSQVFWVELMLQAGAGLHGTVRIEALRLPIRCGPDHGMIVVPLSCTDCRL